MTSKAVTFLSPHLRYVPAERQHTFNIANRPTRWKPPCDLPQALPSSTNSPAKVFGRVGCGEGEPFSKKVSLPAGLSPAPNLHRSACSFSFLLPARFPLRGDCPTLRRPFGDDHPIERSPPYQPRLLLPGAARHQGWRSAGGSSAAVPLPQQKNPRRTGDKKKTPSRCELQGGLEQSLAAAYFPT